MSAPNFNNLSQRERESFVEFVQRTANTNSGTFVDTAGDTMTGELVLGGGAKVGSTGSSLSHVLLSGATLAPASVSGATVMEQTFAIPVPLAVADTVFVTKPSADGIGIGNVRVSAPSTLAIQFVNAGSAALTPTTEYYKIFAIR